MLCLLKMAAAMPPIPHTLYVLPERGGLHPLPLNLGGLVIRFNQKNKADMILLDLPGISFRLVLED